MRVGHFLKLAGKITAITLFCLVITASLVSYFYEKEIKQLIVNELNKNLNTRIHVGEFDFTLLRHFPNASLEMKQVVIEEPSEKIAGDTLLFSDRLSLMFNIRDLFSREVRVKKILISDGTVNIRIDEKGHANYLIFRKSDNPATASTVEIQKITLREVHLRYVDKRSDQDYAMLAHKAALSGTFASNKFSFRTESDLFIDKLFVHGGNYVDRKHVLIKSGLEVDLQSGIYRIDDSQIRVADVPFTASGRIMEKSSDWFLDLTVNCKEASIASLNSLVPAFLQFHTPGYGATGKTGFHSAITGQVGGKNKPSVSIDFTVRNGSVSAGDAVFENVSFSGSFRNPDGKKANSLTVPDLTASLAGHKIQASLQLSNLPDAYLTLHAKSQLDLRELQPFLRLDTLESLSGDLAMNVSYSGKIRELKDLKKNNLPEVKASGDIDISHVCFKLKKNPLEFTNLNGSFSLHDRDVYVKNLSGNISSTDFRLEGVFRNFISFLLIPGQPGDMKATMRSNTVNLDELLVNKTAGSADDTSYIMKFNPRLVCELDVEISKLHFRRFSAEDIRGQVHLDRQVISGRGLQFRSMGGNVAMDATINASRRDSINMIYDARFADVDITRLFFEMENFDQQTMTEKNVKGRVSADIQFLSMWSKDLTLNSQSVRSTGAITVENGELVNFKPIQALSKYLHVPDLNHIHFSTLKNNISIANRKIYIPKMDINSSAINLSGNGTHDFDNNVDYHLSLLLSDVLGRKAFNNNSEFGEIADDGLGRSKIFISMKGSVNNPHFSYDRKSAGEKIKNDIALEKQNLKGVLKQEFGLFRREPSVQTPRPKKSEEMQIDWTAE
jgi:hypothetical protein